VPDVSELNQAQADAKLREAGFVPEFRFRTDPDAAPGTVIDQNPKQATEQKVGTRVTVVLAKAPVEPTPNPTSESPTPTPTPSPTPTLSKTPLFPNRGS
jgi:beta-lactam-binding protein with PASTA domain